MENNCHTQASQGGYAVEYTQGPQSGYPGNYLNQSAHPGYPHMGAPNDIVSQVSDLLFVTITLHLLNFLLIPFPAHVNPLCAKPVLYDPGSHGPWFTWNVYASGIQRPITR